MKKDRKVEYHMQRGMVDYFMNLLDLSRKEVWVVIKEACHSCIDRLDNNNKSKSWKYADIPNSEIKLRIDVERIKPWRYSDNKDTPDRYWANVKFSNISDSETITDQQVEEYIVEKILLDLDEDEECSTTE